MISESTSEASAFGGVIVGPGQVSELVAVTCICLIRGRTCLLSFNVKSYNQLRWQSIVGREPTFAAGSSECDRVNVLKSSG